MKNYLERLEAAEYHRLVMMVAGRYKVLTVEREIVGKLETGRLAQHEWKLDLPFYVR